MKKRFRLLVFCSILGAAAPFVLSAQPIRPAGPMTAQNDTIYMMVDKMPEFPGGVRQVREFQAANVKMPQECREHGIGGTSVVEFVVEKDGTPSHFELVVAAADYYKSDFGKWKLAEMLDDEALRLARLMPKWSPAMQDGQPVRVRMRFPVKFTN